MTNMAKQGMLPRGITKILTTMSKQHTKPPMCNDCCGAKATRKPWRGKGKRYKQRHLRKHLIQEKYCQWTNWNHLYQDS
jgi:hypothetical protein